MKRVLWLEHWAEGRIDFHQVEVSPSLVAHWPRLALPPGARVFVPLCGKSRDMSWLRERGHGVLGVELARLAVRDFCREAGLTPAITAQPPFERWEAGGIAVLCGDFFDLSAEHLTGVEGVFDRAALVALPPAMRRRYVAHLRDRLAPGVEILLVSVTYPQEQMEGPPFSVAEEEVRALYADAFTVEQLSSQDIFREGSPLHRRGLKQISAQAYHIRRTR